MTKDKKCLDDELLDQVTGGKVDVTTKKSIGQITVLKRFSFCDKPIWDYTAGWDAREGEVYQIYGIAQGDGYKWFLCENGLYAPYIPQWLSYTLTI